MLHLSAALALASLSFPALAARPVIFEATSPDRASGFRTMAECEAALGPRAGHRGKSANRTSELRGTMFNRTAGNVSRCELVAGEPHLVVYPIGRKARPAR